MNHSFYILYHFYVTWFSFIACVWIAFLILKNVCALAGARTKKTIKIHRKSLKTNTDNINIAYGTRALDGLSSTDDGWSVFADSNKRFDV